MRAAVDAMGQDGSNMSAELEFEVNALRHAPLDDTVAEGPHSVASHHHKRARRATFPWIASGLRLDPDFEGLEAVH